MTSLSAQQKTAYPSWLDRSLYPYESHFFETSVGKMHYIDEGDGDPIVFVHGNGDWSFAFTHQIKEMSKTNRCIAFDLMGYGFSDKPYEWDYLPKNHAKTVEEFLNSLNLEHITLVVNDWGGPIALSYAINHPEKIKKLVVINSWMWSLKDDPHFEKFSKLAGGGMGRFMIKNFNFAAKTVNKKATGKKYYDKHFHKNLYKHLVSRKDRKCSWVFPKELINSSDWLDSLWQQKEKINNIPTTIFWGQQDIAFRMQDLEVWKKNWKNLNVITLEHVGHYCHFERPQLIIDELKK